MQKARISLGMKNYLTSDDPLTKLAVSICEAIGNISIPDERGRLTKLFNTNSCAGDDAIENALRVLKGCDLLKERDEAHDWLRAILKDPSENESLKFGIRQYLKGRPEKVCSE